MKIEKHEPMQEPRLLRIGEVAELLGVSRSKAYAILASGGIPTIRLGGRCLRVPLDALREWIARRSTGGAEQN